MGAAGALIVLLNVSFLKSDRLCCFFSVARRLERFIVMGGIEKNVSKGALGVEQNSRSLKNCVGFSICERDWASCTTSTAYECIIIASSGVSDVLEGENFHLKSMR